MSRPWMPMFWGEFIADTQHLDAAESGAYLLLIGHYWSTQRPPPDDDRQLARIARMKPAEWRRARPTIQAFFQEGWKHKRVEFELTEAARISAAGRAGGVASGRVRRERSLNDRSTVVAEPLNDPPNDPATKREGLHLQEQTQREERSSLRSEARKRASRLPSDWLPSTEDFEFAHGEGIAHAEIKIEADKFRNYWTAKAGKDAAKLDWPATWRNWILNAKERKPNGTGSRGAAGKGGPASDFFAGIAQVAANLGGDDPVAGRADENIPRGRVEIEH